MWWCYCRKGANITNDCMEPWNDTLYKCQYMHKCAQYQISLGNAMNAYKYAYTDDVEKCSTLAFFTQSHKFHLIAKRYKKSSTKLRNHLRYHMNAFSFSSHSRPVVKIEGRVIERLKFWMKFELKFDYPYLWWKKQIIRTTISSLRMFPESRLISPTELLPILGFLFLR